jgi:protein-disulfide isomerase
MKRYLPFVIVAIVAIATLGSGAMLYHSRRETLAAIPVTKAFAAKSGAESPHVRGNPDAPVTLEEFGDFQCPPCGGFASFSEQLLKEYDSRVRIVFRNFPLSAHEHAREAATAAEAAGIQGKFWEMHDKLYHEQGNWSVAPNARELFESYAGAIGLDLEQFKKDMDSEKVKDRIESDKARGESLGVKVTPSLFINNQPVEQKDKTPEGVRAEINSALEQKSKSGA